jgi:hypothetical protein
MQQVHKDMSAMCSSIGVSVSCRGQVAKDACNIMELPSELHEDIHAACLRPVHACFLVGMMKTIRCVRRAANAL